MAIQLYWEMNDGAAAEGKRIQWAFDLMVRKIPVCATDIQNIYSSQIIWDEPLPYKALTGSQPVNQVPDPLSEASLLRHTWNPLYVQGLNIKRRRTVHHNFVTSGERQNIGLLAPGRWAGKRGVWAPHRVEGKVAFYSPESGVFRSTPAKLAEYTLNSGHTPVEVLHGGLIRILAKDGSDNALMYKWNPGDAVNAAKVLEAVRATDPVALSGNGQSFVYAAELDGSATRNGLVAYAKFSVIGGFHPDETSGQNVLRYGIFTETFDDDIPWVPPNEGVDSDQPPPPDGNEEKPTYLELPSGYDVVSTICSLHNWPDLTSNVLRNGEVVFVYNYSSGTKFGLGKAKIDGLKGFDNSDEWTVIAKDPLGASFVVRDVIQFGTQIMVLGDNGTTTVKWAVYDWSTTNGTDSDALFSDTMTVSTTLRERSCCSDSVFVYGVLNDGRTFALNPGATFTDVNHPEWHAFYPNPGFVTPNPEDGSNVAFIGGGIAVNTSVSSGDGVTAMMDTW